MGASQTNKQENKNQAMVTPPSGEDLWVRLSVHYRALFVGSVTLPPTESLHGPQGRTIRGAIVKHFFFTRLTYAVTTRRKRSVAILAQDPKLRKS